jgi:hypothetical protein
MTAISEPGQLTINDAHALAAQLGKYGLKTKVATRRASHIEPLYPVSRVLFHLLRKLFGETGRVAEWTRHWDVLWRVNLKPSGGPILPYYFHDRQKAIAAEIAWINDNFESVSRHLFADQAVVKAKALS